MKERDFVFITDFPEEDQEKVEFILNTEDESSNEENENDVLFKLIPNEE